MGFNISGIVINKNYKNNLEDLKKDFGWNLKFVEEIDFEKASANWKEKGVCDIYFSEQASFIFVDMEMCIEAWCVADAKTLTFALSETSMAFKLRYSEGDKVLRSIMEVERNRRIDEGEK